MRCLLVVSTRASTRAAAGAAAVARAAGVVAALTGAEPARLDLGDGMLLSAGIDVHHIDGTLAAVLVDGAYTADGRALDGRAVVDLVRRIGPAALDEAVPPFGAVVRTAPDHPLMVATDACGLRPVAWCRGDGWSAASTSALALARLSDAAFDETAVGVLALVGHQLGDRTGFTGVQLLGPGETLLLRDGEARVETRTAVAPSFPEPLLPDHAVDAGVAAMRDAMTAALGTGGDATLELSGGLDSRMLLAALPPDSRAHTTAVTIDSPGSRDAEVARRLATRLGMTHVVVDRRQFLARPAEAIEQGARDAIRGRDLAGNAIAQAGLDWIERAFPSGPRFTGQNGEFARGVYYRGFPIRLLERVPARGRALRPLDRLLAELRFATNQRAHHSLFRPGFLEAASADVRRDVRSTLSRTGTNWAGATDELYLDTRMRRWAGAELSWAGMSRAVRAPFFHPTYLHWARGAVPHSKRNGVLFARVLNALDPVLAGIELDRGPLTPAALAAGGVGAQARVGADIGRRGVGKLRQRITRRRRPPSGVVDLGPAVLAAWIARPGALDRVAELPFLDSEALAAVAAGTRSLDTPSVALLLALDEALAFTTDERNSTNG